MRQIIFGALIGVMALPLVASAAGTTSAVLSTTGNLSTGFNVAATTAGGASQSTASGPFSQTANLGTASSLQGSISANGHFSASGQTITANSVNGKVTVQSLGWSAP